MTIDDADIGDIVEYNKIEFEVLGKMKNYYDPNGVLCGDVFFFNSFSTHNNKNYTTCQMCCYCELVKKNVQVKVKEKSGCNCDIMLLMSVGCKCGNFVKT